MNGNEVIVSVELDLTDLTVLLEALGERAPEIADIIKLARQGRENVATAVGRLNARIEFLEARIRALEGARP